jgi:hypothetical protein
LVVCLFIFDFASAARPLPDGPQKIGPAAATVAAFHFAILVFRLAGPFLGWFRF